MMNVGLSPRGDSKVDVTLAEGFRSPLVKTMNDTQGKFTLPSSPYIISPFLSFTLLSSHLFLSAGPEPAPAHRRSFCLFHGLICLPVSLPASLCHALALLISLTPPQERIQVSQFHLGHASCLQQSIRLLGKMASPLHRGPFHLDNLAPLP